MAPKSKPGQDDSKSETPNVKERNGTGSRSTKMSRGASAMGSNTKDKDKDTNGINGDKAGSGVQRNAASQTTTSAITSSVASVPAGLQWSTFDRDILHDYRREYRLDTPTCFSNSYHHWILSRPGIGLRSPTMARKTDHRRQSKDDLAKVVRKHFNGLGIQENDVVVGFLHKVRNPGIARPRRNKLAPHSSPLP
ncbi:histone deacetylase complex subunit SAP30 [Microdochium nivale]|nr:histone deacetylase complex subunit SAP30 [Microdochium nivale]